MHETAHVIGGETPKSESPEISTIVNDIPQSNPITPHARLSLQSKTRQKTSTEAPLPSSNHETPTQYKRTSVQSATGLTTPRNITPDWQSAASNTEDRPPKSSNVIVTTYRSSSSKAFVSGQRKQDIWAVESDIENSQDVPLGRTAKISKQHQSAAVQLHSGPKLFDRSNGSPAIIPIPSRSSRDLSNELRRSTSGQAISHGANPNQSVSKSPKLASVTVSKSKKGTLQRAFDQTKGNTARGLPLFPDSHTSSVKRLSGPSVPSKHGEDFENTVIVENQQEEKRVDNAEPFEHRTKMNGQRNRSCGTSSVSASCELPRQRNAQPLLEEPSIGMDVDKPSGSRENTFSDASLVDSSVTTRLPSIYRSKAAKKTAPAKSSDSEDSGANDNESDTLSEPEQIPESKMKKGAGRTVSAKGNLSESKTAKKKVLHAKNQLDAPTASPPRSSEAVEKGPLGAASKAPTNILSVRKTRTSITPLIPRHGSIVVNRSDSPSLPGAPSHNITNNDPRGASTTSRTSPSLARHSHKSVSFDDEPRDVSETVRTPSLPLVDRQKKPVGIASKPPVSTKRQKEKKFQERQKWLEEARAECARFNLCAAQRALEKPGEQKVKLSEAVSEPLIPPMSTAVEESDKDKVTATVSPKATKSATSVARSLGSRPNAEAAVLAAAVVPLPPESLGPDRNFKHAEPSRDDEDESSVEENNDVSYALKRTESKSKSRSPARAVSSSTASSSASDSGSESDTDSHSHGDAVGSEGSISTSLSVKRDTSPKPVVSAIETGSDTASSDSDDESDNGKLPIAKTLSLSKSVPASPARSRERTNSESAGERDSAERQVQREIRESMEPSRSSQMAPPPKTSTKTETFSALAQGGPTTLKKREGFSVNARHPTFSSQKNNPKYKNPVIDSSRQTKPAAKANSQRLIETELADNTDNTESEDEDDEETSDDDDVGAKPADPQSSQSSKGKAAAELNKLFKCKLIKQPILVSLLIQHV